MNRVAATTLAFALIAGQATAVSAATADAPVFSKVAVPACAAPMKAAKAAKVAKIAPVSNRCESDDRRKRRGAVPLVFGGATVAGVVAIAISANQDHPASP